MLRKTMLFPFILGTMLIIVYLLGFSAFVLYSLYPPQITPSNSQSQTAIVLTGGENRISEGVSLLNNKSVQRVFVSGVGKDVGLDDIFPKSYQSLLCCVTLGYEAKDTIGNMHESFSWLKKHKEIKSFYLITSSYHMPRAYHLFSRHPHAKDFVIHPYAVKMERLSPDMEEFWHLTFKEYNKLLFTYTDISVTHAR